jgi:DGQHR domain-containing protein
MVLQALVSFKVLKEHALFTSKANPNDSSSNYKMLAEESLEYYQRRIDNERLKDIQKYIIRSISDEQNNVSLATLFPTSMIIAMPLEDEDLHVEDDEINIELKGNVFIVDGQHRLMAMLLLHKTLLDENTIKTDRVKYMIKYLEDYKFNCTLLVNFDLWEQGQVFINVNFKQKPVNKSLYYEVFGSEYREDSQDDKRNQIYMAHCLVKELNEQKNSPFRNKIKMLGTGKGYISQAFFVESLLTFFRVKGIWWKNPIDYTVSEEEYEGYLTELLSYFYAISEVFKKYWPAEDDDKGTIICKTTGVGAWLRLLQYIHKVSEDVFTMDIPFTKKGEICESYYGYMKEVLAPILKEADALFGAKSEFVSGSGKGFEVRMFKRLRSILKKINEVSIDDTNIRVATSLGHEDISVDDIVEQLQNYYWQNEEGELASLSHHYEYEEMEDVEFVSAKLEDGNVKCKMAFNSSVTIYLDNEDDDGVTMSFPTEASFELQDNGGKWEINEESVRSKFDTSSY